MPQPKGKTGNPAGRPKGAINRANRPLKENISNFLEKSWPSIKRDINKLEPKDRVAIYEKLLSFVMPRLKSIDATVEVEKKLESLSDEKLNQLIDEILKN